MATPQEPDGRRTAFGNQLVDVHLWLREELSGLRADVNAFLEGGGELPPGPRPDLRANCLAFCSALNRHHTGEDEGAFPALAEAFPELRPVLEELGRDHHMVTEILRELQELLGGLRPDPGPAEARRVRAELDGLSALLESHFGYEERRIVAALNALRVPGWEGTTPGFLLTGRVERPPR